MRSPGQPYITSGVDCWGGYVSIEGYDPPPGQRGWYNSMRSAIGLPRNTPKNVGEKWRRRAVRGIRRLMRKLRQPQGTDLHQLIRAYQGLPLTHAPEPGPSREAEDARLAAEFEWELRQNFSGYPATLQNLLDRHFRNSAEIAVQKQGV